MELIPGGMQHFIWRLKCTALGGDHEIPRNAIVRQQLVDTSQEDFAELYALCCSDRIEHLQTASTNAQIRRTANRQLPFIDLHDFFLARPLAVTTAQCSQPTTKNCAVSSTQ